MSWGRAPFWLSGMGLESGGLGTSASSLGLWFAVSTFRALRCLGILAALTGLWHLRRGQQRASGSLRLAGSSVPAIGRLCEKCDGKCVICDSYVRPCTLVRICDECNYGSYQGRCVICGGPGVSDAYYCKECTIQEKDRDGCPKIVNLGSSKTDLFYERKKYGFKKR